MPFCTDAEFAREVGDVYGEYVATFHSTNDQVRADLFRRGDWVEAHVAFADGLRPERVTDRYLGEIRQFADERGYGKRIRILYSS